MFSINFLPNLVSTLICRELQNLVTGCEVISVLPRRRPAYNFSISSPYVSHLIKKIENIVLRFKVNRIRVPLREFGEVQKEFLHEKHS